MGTMYRHTQVSRAMAHSPASHPRGPRGKNPLVLRLGHSADSDWLAVERVGTGWSGGPVR